MLLAALVMAATAAVATVGSGAAESAPVVLGPLMMATPAGGSTLLERRPRATAS